jgi:hypothetical protein
LKPRVRLMPSVYCKPPYRLGAVVFVHGHDGVRKVFGKPCVFYHTVYANSIDALSRGVNEVLPHAMKAAA